MYSYMLKLQSPSKYSLIYAIYLSGNFFSSARNSFWAHQFWCLLVLLLCFWFTSSTSAQHFLFRTFFIRRNKKRSCSGWHEVNREGGTWESHWFGQKLVNSHEMGKHADRVFKKNSLKPHAASHNNASWYTGTDGFLEYTPSGESLNYKGPALLKIIPDFWGSPQIHMSVYMYTHTHIHIHI